MKLTIRFLALLPALAFASDVKEVKEKVLEEFQSVIALESVSEPVISLEGVSENAIAPSTTGSNVTGLIEGIEDVLLSEIPKNLELSGGNTVLEKVEGFGLTVDALVDTISDLQASVEIPSEMKPTVAYVQNQLQVASAQTKQVTIELAEAFRNKKNKKKQKNKEHGQDDEDGHQGKHHEHRQHKHHGHAYEKLKDIPKFRHHFEFHEAMANGDMNFVHRHMENLRRQHQSFQDQRVRRTQSYQVKQCQKLVKCVEDWSLFDVVSFYYGVYVDDNGKFEDNLMVADAAGTDGIWKHVNEIKKWMDEARRTAHSLNPCNSLLHQFHTNENKEEFSIYHGPTISKICRAQGSTKYISIGEIRKKIGAGIADQLFDDMVRCSSDLGDKTFFTSKNTPRVPSKTIGDRHGKTRYNDVNRHFAFLETSPLSGAHTSSNKRISYDDIKRVDAGCVSKIDQYYMNLYKKQTTALFKPGAVSASANYPSLNILVSDMMDRVYIGVGNDSTRPENICEITSSAFTKCPQDKNRGTSSGRFFSDCNSAVNKFTINGLFSGFDDGVRDKASLLALGDQMSVGMVCAHAEKAKQNPMAEKVPGYCCLDTPAENSLWGNEFSCEDGKAKCKMLGPVLSGLSQSACDPWSGTWCPYARDCSELKNCVSGEMAWAKSNKKKSYLSYVEKTPEIKDTKSFDDCGAVREYLGFKSDYPLDDEICEDLQFLRNNKNFDDLDQSFGDSSVKPSDKPPDQAELVEPDDPEVTEEQYDAMDKAIFALGVTLSTFEMTETISTSFECPEDLTGAVKSACAVTKNVLAVVSITASYALKVTIETLDDDKPTVNDYQQFEVYHNADVLYKNMKIMNTGIGDIRKDIWKLENERRLSEHGTSMAKFAGCDGLDQDGDGVSDNCEEDFNPPELVIHPGMGLEITSRDDKQLVKDHVFKSDHDAFAHLKTILSVSDDCAPASSLELNLTVVGHSEDSCTSTIGAKPIHICDGFPTVGEEKLFDVKVDTQPPVVTCGFNAQDTKSVEGKTIFIEQNHSSSFHLKDTGFFYKIKDACSSSVKVDISVKSSEYEAPEEGRLAKALAMRLSGTTDVAKVLVSPSTCESRKGSAGVILCESVPGRKERIYELQVTATNEAGWTAAESCRVVVLSNGQNSRSLAVEGDHESIPMYHIDEVSLEWQP